MKRLLVICLILAAFILPVQADIIWDNATNTIYAPYHWSACNATTKEKVTLDEVRIPLYSAIGFSNDGVPPTAFGSTVDGTGRSYVSGMWSIDQRLTAVTNEGAGWNSQYFFATCDDNYLMVDGFTPNTRETAYYIEPGTYLYGFVDDGSHAVSTANLTINATEINIKLPGKGAVKINYGVQATAELAHYQDANGQYYYFTTTPPAPPIADFTGSPREGQSPLHVTFLDNSSKFGGPYTYNWSVSPNTSVFLYPASGTTEDIEMIFNQNGNYTITHGISAPYGSDIETKADYIWVYNSTVMITTPWRAEDMVFGGLVANATIDLLDIENGSWVNVTSSTGKSSITTLADHKLSGYGFAVGFNDAEQLIVEPQAFPGYVLYMYPTGFTNVSEGNVTVFVKAEDVDTGLSVIGATVTGQAAGGGSQVKTTNSAGWAQFVFPNNTNVHFKAEKSGYTGSTTIVLNTGVPSGGDTFVSGTVYLTKGSITVLPTTTVTTLPGGGTPTPVQTYLPHCDPAASDYSAEECRAEQSSFSLSWLADNMLLLIQICFIFTILYIAGWKP